VKLSGGAEQAIEADHIIAATGYQVDVDRIGFLAQDLRSRIRLTGRAPALSSHFESSVPGLYFAGTAAANSFGPLLRFAYGAGFASRRIAGHVAGRARAQAAQGYAPATAARETQRLESVS
jgi:hypothetical protein